MKILKVHNYYQRGGGEDKSFEAEATVLEENGHTVLRYTRHNDSIKQRNPLALATASVWNHSVYRELRAIVQRERPDILHCHNTFPLISPSAYYAAKVEGVPVVQSLSNYRLFCANGLFFRQGRVCTACLGKRIPWLGVRHACYRHSRVASAVSIAVMLIHRSVKTWSEMVDVYVTTTEFARRKFAEGGLPFERIVVKPDFVVRDPVPGCGDKGYALFVGRLNPEKGVRTLLAAWERLGEKLPLKILGDGMLAEDVQTAALRLKQVEWLGNKNLSEVYDYMGEAAFLIFPSESYETFGRVVVESFAKGTPVIAAGLGAVAEITAHGSTGLHFCPGNVEDLVEKVEWLLSHPGELASMRRRARREYETKYSAERNYELTMSLYEAAIARNHVPRVTRILEGI